LIVSGPVPFCFFTSTSMSWTAPTVNDLKTRLAGPELTALSNAAKATGQADPTQEILTRAIDECRGYLAARPDSDMGPAGTLPLQVHGACLDLARYRLCTRLPVASLLTDARYNEYKDALTLLHDVQAGRCIVEAPDTLTTEALPANATPSIRLPHNRFTLP
jgi:phage gp36-like protein